MLKQKLMSVRTEMSQSVTKATKMGTKAICQNSKDDQNKINAYCENNFIDNYYKLLNCKDRDGFCYSCCENEFGDVHVAEREDCYNMCDGKKSKKKGKKGNWIWTDNIY